MQDLAAVDVGVLNRWELEITTRTSGAVEIEESPGTLIPDNTLVGIERTLVVNQSGQLADMEVALDITHTYIGDLTVTLASPSGMQVVLHNRGGGSQDNLITKYSSATNPVLQGLRGQATQGAWKLRVADLEAADVGKLNRWALKIITQ